MGTLSKFAHRIPRHVWIAPPIGWMLLIFFLSSRQSIAVSDKLWINFMLFKSLHVIEYAILTLLNFIALYRNVPTLIWEQAARYAGGFALVYAIFDEIHQTYVPTRSGKIEDVLIDCIGILSVYWLISFYEKYSKGSSSSLRARASQ